MRRRALLAAWAVTPLWMAAAGAQQKGMPVIGFLSSRSPEESGALVAAFRQGLKEAGFAEGENVAIEFRWAENQYDRLPALTAELVSRPVAVILAAGGPASAFAAKAATSTIPIVFASVGNPVEMGLVASLNRPETNVTGSDYTLTAELEAKRLQLLHELVPALTKVGVLANPDRADFAAQVENIGMAAKKLGLEAVVLPARDEGEIDRAFAAVLQQRLGALLVGADPLFASRGAQILALAARHAVPAIYQWREFVTAGGLMSYGASLTAAYRQAGLYAGRILKGAKPAELPVQRPTKIEFLINLTTANALGLTVPQSILARADEVIE